MVGRDEKQEKHFNIQNVNICFSDLTKSLNLINLNPNSKFVPQTKVFPCSAMPKRMSQPIETIISELKSYTPKVKDAATKIKVQEVIKLITPIVESKSIKDDHLVALLQYIELSKEMKSL